MPDPTGRVSHLPEFHRGVSWKQYCRVATTANITIATALNAGDTIDGVVLAAGDRVLVKDQSTGSQNGIYLAGVTPIRDFDMDQDSTTSVPAQEVLGAVIIVIAGTVNAGTQWRCTNTTAPTLGTTALTFAQFGTGSVTSVALTVPAEFSVSGSPVTSSGTLAISKANESANTVWAGPTSGSAAAPAFRALVTADMPSGFGYHEVVMVTGSSPPDPVLNSAGDDWVYSS